MKFIKIFLASSIVEFRDERYELAAFINSLNNICVKKDVYLKMEICEELSNCVAQNRKQDEYNAYICDSDYLIMLFGKNAGEYTIEEFNVAWEHRQANGNPKIYTYFEQLPEGECVDKSVLNFMERLENQLGQDCIHFAHLDIIKLNLLLELTQNEQFGCDVKFQDGQVYLDGQPVLSLAKVPLYKEITDIFEKI